MIFFCVIMLNYKHYVKYQLLINAVNEYHQDIYLIMDEFLIQIFVILKIGLFLMSSYN